MRRFWVLIGAGALVAAGCSGRSGPAPEATTTTAATPPTTAVAAPITPRGVVADSARFDTGSPTLTPVFVDPVNGDDSRDGATRERAMKTITAAWRSIPVEPLTTGYEIQLLPGDYTNAMPSVFDSRTGTRTAPIEITSSDNRDRATIGAFDATLLAFTYLVGVNVRASDTAVRCIKCDHFLVRDVTVDATQKGSPPIRGVFAASSTNIFVEDSDIAATFETGVSFDAVRTGHVITSRVHGAQGWCANFTGGTAAVNVEANEFSGCAEGGVTLGLESDLATMDAPYLGYQAYGLRVVNNVLNDVDGPAFSVAGAYGSLIAFNTAYRVGRRDHVAEAVIGRRGCLAPATDCEARRAAGGWGATGEALQIVPSLDVGIYNNVILNPDGYRSTTSQFLVEGCREVDSAATGVPSPTCADAGLRLAGNVVWNGAATWPLGAGDDGRGCAATNPTCNGPQLVRDNSINAVEPRLASPGNGDFRPAPHSPLLDYPAAPIPPFAWTLPFPALPRATPDVAVPLDRAGEARRSPVHPGAY